MKVFFFRNQPECLEILVERQKRLVSKVLLDGLYDPDSQLSKLLPVSNDVMGDIIWKGMLTSKWEFYHDDQ